MTAWKKTLKQISVVIIAGMFLGGCASTPQTTATEAQSEQDSAFDDSTVVVENNPDKLEKYNRAIFKFNDVLDRYLLKPVAKGYDAVFPVPIKIGVGNFFSNIGEVSNVINDGLQWKWKQAANDSGRLVINTTAGVAGIFDVAKHVGLEKSDGENFTQTLAKWGVPRGSYVVLPFLGPSTLRGVASMPVDIYTDPVTYVDPWEAQLGIRVVETVHTRAELLEAEELASGDYYLFVRDAYLQRLEYLEKDGNVDDSFGGGNDDFGDDDYDF